MPLDTSFLQLSRFLFSLLSSREQKGFYILLFLVFAGSVAELAIAGLIALMAAVFGSPEAVLNSSVLRRLHEFTGPQWPSEPRLLALSVLVAVILALVFRNALTICQLRESAAFSERAGAVMRLRLFRFYQRAPYVWILRHGSANMLFGLNAGPQCAEGLLAGVEAFSGLAMLFMLLCGLMAVMPAPAFLFLIVLGLCGALTTRFLRRESGEKARQAFDAEQKINAMSLLALQGLKELRLYTRENFLFTAFKAILNQKTVARIAYITIRRLPVSALEILAFLILLAVMLFLIFVQDAGMARISGIMGFMAAAAWRAMPVANRLMSAVATWRERLPYLLRVRETLTRAQTLGDAMIALPEELPLPLPFTHRILVENVSFCYPETSVSALSGISLTIRAGNMVGIVGLSGAGKSTLVNVLTSLLPPDDGRIFIDGQALTRDNAVAWLRRLGYVAQSPYILDATLAENVALSRWGEEVDRQRVLECCRMAALDFVDDLEHGLDTVLGDRGMRLSGGQAQRVAIARALYSEPDLIIFDEATSSLDIKNERAILDTILSLRGGVTLILIAHRLTTVENCDDVIWLEKGRVRLSGRREDVLPLYEASLQTHI
jgi:ABC-type multidrug transport system fused ATPase/permease subunit